MKISYLVFVCSLLLIGCLDFVKSNRGIDEQALISKLLKNYNKIQKPPGTINIPFNFKLNKIIAVEAKTQIVKLNVILKHEWIDTRLIWSDYSYTYWYIRKNRISILLKYFSFLDPEDNANISQIKINSDRIWV